MNKRKLLTLALAVAMIAILAIGGTLAYFTDTDAETNVFTTSNVSIDLEETFVQESLLMPGIDVNKDAWIYNDGNQDAYVWAEVLIPAILDDADTNSPDAPGLGNSLHVNYPGATSKEYAQDENPDGKYYNADKADGKLWIQQYNADGISYGYAGQETIGTVTYNKFIKFYDHVLPAGEKTPFFLDKVYMDKKVTQHPNYKDVLILADETTQYDGPWQIIVRAYGIQEEGFSNVIEAWKAYDGDMPAVAEDGML